MRNFTAPTEPRNATRNNEEQNRPHARREICLTAHTRVS